MKTMTDLLERTAVERLTSEIRSYTEAHAVGSIRLDMDDCRLLLSELERLQALVGRLEGALRPFAEAASDADEGWVDDAAHAWESAMSMAVSFGDFRAARQALSLVEGG